MLGLSGFWGIRSIPGVYLGCWVNPTTRDVKFRFTAEAIQRKEIKIQYIPSKLNYADIFTKALTEAAFKSCLDLCRNRKSPSSRDLLIPDAAEVTEINHETFLVMTVERTENW